MSIDRDQDAERQARIEQIVQEAKRAAEVRQEQERSFRELKAAIARAANARNR